MTLKIAFNHTYHLADYSFLLFSTKLMVQISVLNIGYAHGAETPFLFNNFCKVNIGDLDIDFGCRY
jgi:hypothetical protein